jgi:hypothetical protein
MKDHKDSGVTTKSNTGFALHFFVEKINTRELTLRHTGFKAQRATKDRPKRRHGVP